MTTIEMPDQQVRANRIDMLNHALALIDDTNRVDYAQEHRLNRALTDVVLGIVLERTKEALIEAQCVIGALDRRKRSRP